VLFTLPSIQLPDIMAGVHLLGAVSAEALLGAFYDGLRLATMIICVGAANSLANPKRLLAAVPPALYEIGTVLVVSVSVFPQLAESAIRVKRARALRASHRRGRKALRGIVIPVLADALDRSLLLAAAMDSRGYGRRADVPRRQRLLTSTLLTAGVLGLCIGVYGILDATTPRYLGLPMVVGGVLIGAVGFDLAGRRVHRTRYRPDRWRVPELFVVTCGVVAGTAVWVTSSVDPAIAYPSLFPISWPAITPLPLLGILTAALPAVLTPPPPGSAVTGREDAGPNPSVAASEPGAGVGRTPSGRPVERTVRA
jgi:energy-coupling factor transport system permease protein